jgi:Raf kinase inhibitor-like YbhB/YbcL family protein
MALTIRSSAFADQARIPKRFTGDGEDVSPELSWSGVPANAKELALICDDPDAPTPEPWVHWVIYKIPARAAGLRENISKTGSLSEPPGALQGVNSWSEIGYRGPAPPRGHGVHHYHFKLYVLDTALNAAAGVDKKKLLAVMQGHIIAQGELLGTYER